MDEARATRLYREANAGRGTCLPPAALADAVERGAATAVVIAALAPRDRLRLGERDREESAPTQMAEPKSPSQAGTPPPLPRPRLPRYRQRPPADGRARNGSRARDRAGASRGGAGGRGAEARRQRRRRARGGTVDYSTDAAVTWLPASSPGGLEITAGSSPSATVCWLVGRGGLVLVSADGRTFMRMPFPEAADLTSVVAASASTATVGTKDGSAFATDNGGRTWRRQ